MFVPANIALCKIKETTVYLLTDYISDETICFNFKEDALQWAWGCYCENMRAEDEEPDEEDFQHNFYEYFELKKVEFKYRQDLGVNGRG